MQPYSVATAASGRVWVTNVDGLLFQSDPELMTWQELPVDLEAPTYGQVAVDAADDCHLYYSSTVGFVKSTDCGLTWTDISWTSDWIGPVVTSPSEAGVAYALIYDTGVYKTEDGGAAWVDITPTGSGRNYDRLIVHPADPLRLYLQADTIYLSDDAGDSWVQANINLPDEPRELFIDPTSPDTAFIARYNTLYRTDNGLVWAAVGTSPGVSHIAVSGSLLLAGQADDYDQPAVLGSRDGGQTWDTSALSGEDVSGFFLRPGPVQGVLAATDSGLYLSEDLGISWRRIGANIPASRITALASDPDDPATVFAAAEGCSVARIARSRDQGLTWNRPWPTEASEIWSMAVLPTDPAVVLAGGMDGVFLSYDNGDTWLTTTFDDGHSGVSVKMITPHPLNPSIVYLAGGSRGLHRSDDAGVSWQAMVIGYPYDCNSVVVGHDNPDFLLMGTNDGVARSFDAGHSWAISSDLSIQATVIDPTDDSWILAASASFQQLYRSEDGGVTWVPSGLSGTIYTLAASPICTSCFVAGTANGLYRSTDRGVSWVAWKNNINRAIYAADGTIYGALADSKGVTTIRGILFQDGFELGDTSQWTYTEQGG